MYTSKAVPYLSFHPWSAYLPTPTILCYSQFSVPFEHCVFHDHAFSVIGKNFLFSQTMQPRIC